MKWTLFKSQRASKQNVTQFSSLSSRVRPVVLLFSQVLEEPWKICIIMLYWSTRLFMKELFVDFSWIFLRTLKSTTIIVLSVWSSRPFFFHDGHKNHEFFFVITVVSLNDLRTIFSWPLVIHFSMWFLA